MKLSGCLKIRYFEKNLSLDNDNNHQNYLNRKLKLFMSYQ